MITKRTFLWTLGCSTAALAAGRGWAQQDGITPTAQMADKDRFFHPQRKLLPDEAVFFNSDHSPVGAHASLVYGLEASGGLNMLDVRRARGRPLMVQEGIVVALKDGARKASVMPFCPRIADPALAEFVDAAKVRRNLRACIDEWDMGNGLSWRHYTPYWPLKEIETASDADIARFVLPATWMTFTVDNRRGKSAKLALFSLLDPSPSTSRTWGGQHGFEIAKTVTMSPKENDVDAITSTHAVSLPAGVGALLSAADVLKKYGLKDATSAFEVSVPAGQRAEFTITISHHNDQPLLNIAKAKLYLAKYYATVGDVVQAAAKLYPAARQRAEAYRAEVHGWKLNPYREFLYSHALASFMFNTRLFLGSDRQYLWSVIEGEYDYINTFDLVIDHAFFELDMHPWTVRNELDLFADRFNFVDFVKSTSGEGPIYVGGTAYHHDMGSAFSFKTPEQIGLPYPLMSQEELQNFIICAGMYWKKTGDRSLLVKRRGVLEQCLESMLRRDDVDPAKRDGLTTYVSTANAPPKAAKQGEITTYDSLDISLRLPGNSGYIAGKSFACYLAMEAMFTELGDSARAAQCRQQAGLVAETTARHFDPVTKSFPARFGGETDARVIPAIEGLAYPYYMGLTDAVSASGPYGKYIGLLRQHMDSILTKGICLDATSGAWKLSSTTTNTWESKIYLAQFITEKVLKLNDVRTGIEVDRVNYEIQVLGNPVTCWSDQILSDTGATRGGSRHYPRGVTAFLWSMA